MQSLSTPLNRLHEDGSWFARAHELRVWLVQADGSLRNPVLKLLPKLEFHADNTSTWPLLAEAWTRADSGWQQRANVLAVDWTRRVEAFAAAGVSLALVSARADGTTAFESFQATLVDIVHALKDPLFGVVVVLAPSIVESVKLLEGEILTLLANPQLDRVRWVLVLDVDLPAPQRLIDALGERCLLTNCTVDDDEQNRDLAALLSAPDPVRLGMAMPVGVQPPRRIDDPPEIPAAERDALLRSEGLDPAIIDASPKIRAEVLAAAIQMKANNGAAALEHQRSARDLCATAGLFELQAITQIGLASYLSGLNLHREALQELDGAVNLAREHGLARSESQAHLARGLVLALEGDHHGASLAYVDAAKVAESGGETAMAIEAWRMTGQLGLQLGRDQVAAQAFGEALRVADTAPPDLARGSSAPEVARQLAGVYERHGMTAQAASLHAQADAIERGTRPNVGE